MRVIVTGASGTVGRAFCRLLRESGAEAIAWDRNRVPIDDYEAMHLFVSTSGADAIVHLAVPSQPTGRENEHWLVNYHWPGELAWIARETGCRFLFSSSVMVYTDRAPGPFTPATTPDATEGYGAEKLRTEERVMQQNPDAVVARLGWQIGETAGSNNMIDFLETAMQRDGEIGASTKWLPACSFVEDTAAALMQLLGMPGGIYLVNSNNRWNFYDIVQALNVLHGNHWNVKANGDFVYDQRMMDDRVKIRALHERLPQLRRTMT